METSWRDRKNSLDITALDAAVKAVIDVDLPNGKIPKIMKRHYKENFVRYDIGIGTVGHKDAESYEKTVAGPVFDTIKERAVKNGWKAFYQPSYGSRGSVAWMDYYVQLRIPYDNTNTIQESTCMNSIYDQMNKIDDRESLNEKYNVRTLTDIKKLQESTGSGKIDYKFKIQLGTHTPTGGKYYFIFPERKNPAILPQEVWDKLSVENANATHFPSKAEAKEWIEDNLVAQYNLNPIYESFNESKIVNRFEDDIEKILAPVKSIRYSIEFSRQPIIQFESGNEQLAISKLEQAGYKVMCDSIDNSGRYVLIK